MMTRGFGRVYRPTYRDKRTDEKRASRVWWIEIWQYGRQHRFSSKSNKRSVAEKLLKDRVGEMAAGTFTPSADRATLAEGKALMRDDYKINGRKSWRRAAGAVKRLEEVFPETTRFIDITSGRVGRYIAGRLDCGAKPATVQKELAALKRMFTLAIRANKLMPGHRPYIPSLELRNVRDVFVTEDEFRKILQHLSDDIAPVATFMYWTGWRTSEVQALLWDQVDFDQGVIRLDVGSTKNDDGRELPFTALPELEAVLRRQRARADTLEQALGHVIPSVFFWSLPHAGQPAGRSIKNFLDGWHTACRKAGIADRRVPHDFRRTTVRRYERANVARSLATALTGHRTEAVYRRYAITTMADKAEALAKVAALASSPAIMARLDESRKVPAKPGRLDGGTAVTGHS